MTTKSTKSTRTSISPIHYWLCWIKWGSPQQYSQLWSLKKGCLISLWIQLSSGSPKHLVNTFTFILAILSLYLSFLTMSNYDFWSLKTKTDQFVCLQPCSYMCTAYNVSAWSKVIVTYCPYCSAFMPDDPPSKKRLKIHFLRWIHRSLRWRYPKSSRLKHATCITRKDSTSKSGMFITHDSYLCVYSVSKPLTFCW